MFLITIYKCYRIVMAMHALRSSSLVDLIAPGSSVTAEQIQEAVKQVEALGFRARVQTQLLKSNMSSLSSSVITEKFQSLKKALTASDSEAIWCIRGGYGSQKLMPYLMKMNKPSKPKILIGYSDVTVIQIFLSLKWRWPSLHFPVLVHVKNSSSASLQRFKSLLKGTRKQQSFSGLKLLNPEYISQKKYSTRGKRDNFSESLQKKRTDELQINSYLTGGNLSLIQSSIGTPWAGSFQNKILFLEDIGEAPYRLDRALGQMLNAGVFKGVKALVLGDFIYSNGKSSAREIKQVFQSFSNRVSFPVLIGVPCGHGSKKEALPFLTPCSLKIPSKGKASLDITSPFV